MINLKIAGSLYNWVVVALIVYFMGLLLAWGVNIADGAPDPGADEIIGE